MGKQDLLKIKKASWVSKKPFDEIENSIKSGQYEVNEADIAQVFIL